MDIHGKVLVTGGTGLVGKAIKSLINTTNTFFFIGFKSNDHNIIQCNLSDQKETDTLFDTIKPDYVIHLAANVGGLYKNTNYKVQMLEDNIIINLNVLKACKKYNVKKVICCLSTCIFPDYQECINKNIHLEYPLDETVLHNGPPHHSNDAYAYAKRLMDIQCRAYNEQYSTNFICVIPTNVYGKYDNYNLEDSHVIPGLIHKCYLAKQNNEPFVVKGTGKPLRQFIYSDDLAKLILWTLSNYNSKEPIILADSKEYSIKEVAEYIAEFFEYSSSLQFDHNYSDGQYKKTITNKKLLENIDFQFKPLKEGLQETIEWFKINYYNCRK